MATPAIPALRPADASEMASVSAAGAASAAPELFTPADSAEGFPYTFDFATGGETLPEEEAERKEPAAGGVMLPFLIDPGPMPALPPPAGLAAFEDSVRPAALPPAKPAAPPRPEAAGEGGPPEAAPEMAFQILIQGEEQARPAASSVEASTASSAVAAAGQQAEPVNARHPRKGTEVSSLGPAAPPPAPRALSEPRRADVAPLGGTAELRFPMEAEPETAPVREISWSLKGPGNQMAHVRLTDRSGEVKVSVRTPNQELLVPLRAGLPELLQRLQGEGLQVEAWHPGAVSGPARAASSAGTEEAGCGTAEEKSTDHPPSHPGKRHSPGAGGQFEIPEED